MKAHLKTYKLYCSETKRPPSQKHEEYGVIMKNKIKSTYDEHMESLSKTERKEFDSELRKLALSEMVLAAMKKDEVSVRRLAKIANKT